MAVSTALGRVQPLYKGNYNSTTAYYRLDNVFFNGDTWVCLSDNVIGVIPIEGSAYWQKVASRGAVGATPEVSASATATPLETGENPTVSVETSGTTAAKVYTFNFGIPAGPVGETGVQSIEVSATGRNETDTADLVAGDSPWATADLDSNQKLTMTFGIPPGHDGAGSVSKVDNIEPTNGNVPLSAVRYGAMQTLTEEDKERARQNIGAQKAGSYVDNPTLKDYGTFLQYAGDVSNPTWVASFINQVPNGGLLNYILRKQVNNSYGWTPVYEIPSGGTSGSVLMKTSDADYEYGWSPTITESDIDNIIES